MATVQRWPREDELELLGYVGDEASVVANAIRTGQRDENDLTNRLFAARHPELANRRLSPGQIGFDNLRREWLRIRDTIVRPLVWSHIRSAARRIALREWQWWGNGTRVENEPGVQGRLRQYWRAATPQPPTGADVWRWAWSAAFISWVLRQAGTGRHFRYATAHRIYVHQAIRNVVENPSHPIQAFPVNQVRPRVGDLVCNWRSGQRITYAQLAAMVTPSGNPMHCDVVTDVLADHITVVGGNKGTAAGAICPGGPGSGCTVNRTRRALTNGFLAPLPGRQSGWIAVVRIGP